MVENRAYSGYNRGIETEGQARRNGAYLERAWLRNGNAVFRTVDKLN